MIYPSKIPISVIRPRKRRTSIRSSPSGMSTWNSRGGKVGRTYSSLYVFLCARRFLTGLTIHSNSTGWSTCRNNFTVRHRRLQHVIVTGRGRPGCRLVQPGGILRSASWAGCCAARAKFFCRPSYHAMASELVVEHNLCRLCIMATVVATVRRPVRTTYACTTTPLSFPWSWDTPFQVSYNGGGELGAIEHLGDNLFRRPRGLPPPDQQNYHLDLTPFAFRGDATVLPYHFSSFFNSTPFPVQKTYFTWTPILATPFLDGAPDNRRQDIVFDCPTT
jgi:hypothetical protein